VSERGGGCLRPAARDTIPVIAPPGGKSFLWPPLSIHRAQLESAAVENWFARRKRFFKENDDETDADGVARR
jgi:hypothetical protein